MPKKQRPFALALPLALLLGAGSATSAGCGKSGAATSGGGASGSTASAGGSSPHGPTSVTITWTFTGKPATAALCTQYAATQVFVVLDATVDPALHQEKTVDCAKGTVTFPDLLVEKLGSMPLAEGTLLGAGMTGMGMMSIATVTAPVVPMLGTTTVDLDFFPPSATTSSTTAATTSSTTSTTSMTATTSTTGAGGAGGAAGAGGAGGATTTSATTGATTGAGGQDAGKDAALD